MDGPFTLHSRVARRRVSHDLMDETVAQLSHRDVVDLVAYLGSLVP